MIPQSELDRALARWKSRKMGLSEAVTPQPVLTGAVVAVQTYEEHGDGFDVVASEATVITSGASRGEIEVGSGLISIAEHDDSDDPQR